MSEEELVEEPSCWSEKQALAIGMPLKGCNGLPCDSVAI